MKDASEREKATCRPLLRAEASNSNRADKEEIQGVFVLRNNKAEFVPVETGITGTTDIEVLNGFKEGDEIVTGSYKVLRTLKPGTSVKVDNTAPKKEESEESSVVGHQSSARQIVLRLNRRRLTTVALRRPTAAKSERDSCPERRRERWQPRSTHHLSTRSVGTTRFLHHLHRRSVEDL